jgi:Transposase
MHDQQVDVTGGVDTHGERHVAAVVDAAGRILGTRAFPAEAAGYRQLLAWMGSFGQVMRVGVEGTGAYGAGLARYLAGQDVAVVEVNRPDRQARRRRGKSDTTDAEAAAPGRAERGGVRPAQVRRRAHRGDAGAAGRPPLGDEGPYPGRLADPRSGHHRCRRGARPACRAGHRRPRRGVRPVAARRGQRPCRGHP